jgi:hypothetical protein
MNLSEWFEEMASTQEGGDRLRIRAALRLGAQITLMRIRALGGSYVSNSDVVNVECELDGVTAPVDEAPEAVQPPAPVDDSDLVTL